MPIVINATEEKVSLQIAGNWFNWTPKQEKVIRNAAIARFIESDRRGYGLAVLPDLVSPEEDAGDVSVSDEEMKARKEAFKAQKETALRNALDAYIVRLRAVVQNNQVSMRQDLEKANIKADPTSSAFLSDGELEAMKLVAKYQKKGSDAEDARTQEAKTALEAIQKAK